MLALQYMTPDAGCSSVARCYLRYTCTRRLIGAIALGHDLAGEALNPQAGNVNALVAGGVPDRPFQGTFGTTEPGPGEVSGGRFSTKTREEVLANSDGRCVYCGAQVTRERGPLQYNIDHAVSRSQGGTDGISNANVSCRTCNLRKYTKSVEEFLRIITGGDKK